MTTLKIYTMNPQGLSTAGRLNSILYQSKIEGVDILFIQEHNIIFGKLAALRQTAIGQGYIACISCSSGAGQCSM